MLSSFKTTSTHAYGFYILWDEDYSESMASQMHLLTLKSSIMKEMEIFSIHFLYTINNCIILCHVLFSSLFFQNEREFSNCMAHLILNLQLILTRKLNFRHTAQFATLLC